MFKTALAILFDILILPEDQAERTDGKDHENADAIQENHQELNFLSELTKPKFKQNPCLLNLEQNMINYTKCLYNQE